MSVVIRFDGSYKQRSGRCNCGGVIEVNGRVAHVIQEKNLPCTSPVQAEYLALIMMLKAAYEAGLANKKLTVFGDNQVCILQMGNRTACKDQRSRRLRGRAKLAASYFPQGVSYEWVPREENKLADQLSK